MVYQDPLALFNPYYCLLQLVLADILYAIGWAVSIILKSHYVRLSLLRLSMGLDQLDVSWQQD